MTIHPAHVLALAIVLAPSVRAQTAAADPPSAGNSGNSSEPHLHLHMMDGPDLDQATGIQIRFDELALDGGATAIDTAPIRGNTVFHP